VNWPKYIIEYGQAAAVAAIILSAPGLVIALARIRSRRGRVLPWLLSLAAVFVIYQSAGFLKWARQKVDPLKPAFRAENQRAPELRFTLLADGSPRNLSSYRGKLVVLNLWATWCLPCREEMPALGRLQQKYDQQGLVVIALTDEDRLQVDKFTAFNAIAVVKGRIDPALAPPELYVHGEVARPVTHVIDREGVLRQTLIGGQSYAAFEKSVLPLLAH